MKICLVTTNRADYGLQKKLFSSLKQNKAFNCKLIATGSHLSKSHGYTINEIYNDGIIPDLEIDIQLDDNSLNGIAKSISILNEKVSQFFTRHSFEFIILLGDRFELIPFALLALLSGIRIIHLYGGELTFGAIDDSIRHAISKMSHLHFVSTDEYQNRLIQMGESPDMIHNVGALGVDAIKSLELLNLKELKDEINVELLSKSLLITFHPETNTSISPKKAVDALLNALKKREDTTLIFTSPNFDPDSRYIKESFVSFCSQFDNAHFFESLGQLRYLSCLANVSAVVGNSSSGILEAPSLFTPTINIGDRQKGRVQSKSVINCDLDYESISQAIDKVLGPKKFFSKENFINPYGTGGAAYKIVEILQKIKFKNPIFKEFNNINF